MIIIKLLESEDASNLESIYENKCHIYINDILTTTLDLNAICDAEEMFGLSPVDEAVSIVNTEYALLRCKFKLKETFEMLLYKNSLDKITRNYGMTDCEKKTLKNFLTLINKKL